MRAGRTALVSLTCATVVVCTAAAASGTSPRPIPLRPLPRLTGRGLAARYAAERAAIGIAASSSGKPRALTAPGRTFLDVDPPGFGARRFATGGGGHSDYLSPGGVSLHNLALIALGRTAEVAL